MNHLPAVRALCHLALLLLPLAAQTAQAGDPLPYRITPLGLLDQEHTATTGFRHSSIQAISPAGHIVGMSDRYAGVSVAGSSTWLYRNGQTFDISLRDAEPNGQRYSTTTPLYTNLAGHVAGSSTLSTGGLHAGGRTAWFYDGLSTVPIGLRDQEHTHPNGHRASSVLGLTETGHVLGTSERFGGGGEYLGESVWLYDGSRTVKIGLVGPEFANHGGYSSSAPRGINNYGQVIGHNARYAGADFRGTSGWFFDGTTTIPVGMLDDDHHMSDSTHWTQVLNLNEAGHVLGETERYIGDSWRGTSVWVFDGAATRNIGLIGPEFTSSQQHRVSKWQSNSAQQRYIFGHSNRYGGSASLGQSAWVYDGTETREIGLTDADHTSFNGWRSTSIWQVNQAGQAIGINALAGDPNRWGESVWFFNGQTTVPIGLLDPEHVAGPIGEAFFHTAHSMNEAGQVVGTSARFIQGQYAGNSVWLFDGTRSVNIGLVDAEHTAADGWRYSAPALINNRGHVAGYSERNPEPNPKGHSTWLFDGQSTVHIGLVDAVHTFWDGSRNNLILHMNEAGQVTGFAERYNNADIYLGVSAWIYDPVLGETIPLVPSQRADGYANSRIVFLTHGGLALGVYELFDGMQSLGERIFLWTREGGGWYLEDLIENGLEANGWAGLDWPYQDLPDYDYLSDGRVIGLGRLIGDPDGQRTLFLLTPVPEPSAALLAALGVVLLAARGRILRRAPARVPRCVEKR
jgi:hypothetical protein